MDGEDQETSGDEPGDDWREESESPGLRGWIPPDDRLWRHPSESGASGAGASSAATPLRTPADPGRPGSTPWLVGGALAFLVLALVAAGLAVTSGGTSDRDANGTNTKIASLVSAPTTEPGAGRAPGPTAVTAMVTAIRPSTVEIVADLSTGTDTTTGLVAESGGIIVADAAAVVGARSMAVVEPDGSRTTATLIGADATSGLAALRIPDDLPAATFDTSGVTTGIQAVAMALHPNRQTGSAPVALVYAGTVTSAWLALDLNAMTTTFTAIAVDAPLRRDDLGCPLLDAAGQVSGMLVQTAPTATPSTSLFLPAEVVQGVARQLVSTGSVDHGWLGITASDAGSSGGPPTPDGAILDSVASAGPAALAGLRPGDVITRIDGDQVRSSAELQTRLYADPPGWPLAITLRRGGTTLTTSAELVDADSDSAAPDGGSSS